MTSRLRPARWVMGAIIALVAACFLAVALPNYLHFGARAKSAEAKSTLHDLLRAQRANFAADGGWATSFEQLGYQMERGNRYRFALSREGEVLVPGHPDGGPHAILAVDDFRFASRESNAAHPPAIPRDLWDALGVLDGQLTMAASGNIDVDPTLDVWSISSADRIIEGAHVDAGVPFCHVDDTRQ